MNEKLVQLFAEESKVIFANGKILNGAAEVADYSSRLVEGGVRFGLKQGLKYGFIGGIAATGLGVVAYKRYKLRKSK